MTHNRSPTRLAAVVLAFGANLHALAGARDHPNSSVPKTMRARWRERARKSVECRDRKARKNRWTTTGQIPLGAKQCLETNARLATPSFRRMQLSPLVQACKHLLSPPSDRHGFFNRFSNEAAWHC